MNDLFTAPVSLTLMTADPFVARAVFIKPDVLNGRLVPADELATNPIVWNDTRIVVNHPRKDGIYVSAKSADIPFVGRLYDAVYDDGLVGTVQLEADSLKDAGLYDRLVSGEVVEVSAGFYATVEQKVGIWNGKPYTGVSRNIIPDHIALLPNEVGACSCKDGCGVFSVNAANEQVPLNRIAWMVQDALYATDLYPVSVFMNYAVCADFAGLLYKVPYTLDDQMVVSLGEATAIRLHIIEENPMPEATTPLDSAPEGNDVIMALVAEVGGESALREILAEKQRVRNEALTTLATRFTGVDFTALPTAQLSQLVTQSAVKTVVVEPAGLGPQSQPAGVTYLPLEAIQ